MRFYQIIVLVLLGFCASNMETSPSVRKRSFKLEFVGDNSEKETAFLFSCNIYISNMYRT